MNHLSFVAVRISLYTDECDDPFTYASGFFCKRGGHHFLVSNYHVFAGYRPGTKILSGSHRPTRFSFETHALTFHDPDSPDLGASELQIIESPTMDLYDDVSTAAGPKYLVHPTYGTRIDVAVVPARLTYTVAGTKIDALLANLDDEAHLTRPEVMDDVFVVGFPLNIDSMPYRLPIYKHATVASEPGAYIDTPRFYIDGKTKPGMSGSLVVLRQPAVTTFDGRQLSHTGPTVTLVGIYSGRDVQAPDEYQAELGIVWPLRQCLLPLLDHAVEQPNGDSLE